jgi:signal peptidase II
VLEAGIDARTEDDGAGAGRDGAAERAARRWWLIGAASTLVIVADQLTKWWARNELDSPMHVIGSLQFNLAFNSGTAFSAFQGWGQVIGVLAVIVVVVLLRASRTVRPPWGAVAMGLVLGGAVGNLIDRLVQPGDGLLGGRVTDFIDLQWWPVFNIADAGITVGGVALVLLGLAGDGDDRTR